MGSQRRRSGSCCFHLGLASICSAWAGGRLVDRVGPRSLAVAGSILGIAGYTSFIVAHSSIAALAAASAVLGFAWGLILTGIYPVVIRSASSDKTSVAVSINVLTRNTAVALGAQIAFAIIAVQAWPANSRPKPASPAPS